MIDCVVLENLSENLFSVLCNRLSDDNLIAIISQPKKWSWTKHINNPSEAVCLAAVKNRGIAIQYMTNPSEEVCLAATTQDGYALRYLLDPSEEVFLAAVKNDGMSIYFIENPSEEMCMAAVKQNGWAFEQIKKPSKKVLRVAKDFLIEIGMYYLHIGLKKKHSEKLEVL